MPQTTLDLPENLGARCSLLYVWDEEYTLRALEGYLQFMELKANFEDWDADQLAPSGVIDLVWQQHLLYNKQYSKACFTYCDNVIGYDPDVTLMADNSHLDTRVKTTKIALKALYGRGYDKDVWNFQSTELQKKGKVTFNGPKTDSVEPTKESTTAINKAASLQASTSIQTTTSSITSPQFDAREDELDGNVTDNTTLSRDGTISDSDTSDLRTPSNLSASHPPQASQSSMNRSSKPNNVAATKPSNNPSESVTVKIKCFIDGKTQDTCIRVKRTTKMKKVEDCLARLMNLDSSESLRFLVDGEQVSAWETLESMKVEDPEQHWFTVMPKVGFQ